jgi:hypothetical protein
MSRFIPGLSEKSRFLNQKLRGWAKLTDPKPGQVLPKGRKKIWVQREDYVFNWTLEDTERLRALERELELELTLQQFSPRLPIVGMFDSSPWSASAVFGQFSTVPIEKEVQAQSLLREVRPITFLSKAFNDTQSRWS